MSLISIEAFCQVYFTTATVPTLLQKSFFFQVNGFSFMLLFSDVDKQQNMETAYC